MQILKAKNINIFSATILLLLGSFILSSNVSAERSTPVTVVNSADDPLPVEIQGLNSTPNFFSETNIFVKIDGIPGESTDDAHSDEIEAISFSQSVKQSASASASSGGGASSERANFSDVIIVKNIDKCTPKLYVASADGTHISEVIIYFDRPYHDNIQFYEVKLTDVIISYVSFSEGVETVGFNFGRIEWTYTQQKRADGSGGGNVAGGWDLEMNTKI